MPDSGTRGSDIGAALAAALVVGLTAGTTVTGVALGAGEAPSDRLAILAIVSAVGGFAAAASAMLLATWIAADWKPALRSTIGGIAVAALFVPATLFCFAVKIRIIDGRIEGDLASGIASGDILFSLMGAMGMFTPTGLRYLAPWPLAAVALASALILHRWPRPTAYLSRSS